MAPREGGSCRACRCCVVVVEACWAGDAVQWGAGVPGVLSAACVCGGTRRWLFQPRPGLHPHFQAVWLLSVGVVSSGSEEGKHHIHHTKSSVCDRSLIITMRQSCYTGSLPVLE